MRVSAKIGLTVGVIIISAFLIGSLKAIMGYDSSDPITSIGIYGLLIGGGSFWGIIAIWRTKPKNIPGLKHEDEVSGGSISTTPSDPVSIDNDSFTEQRTVLLNLQKEGILTDSEYEEKLKIIDNRERDRLRRKKEAALLEKKHEAERLIEQQKKQLIKKLDDLLFSGILTEKEFEEKTDHLYSECKKQFIESSRRKIDYNKLNKSEKRYVRDFYIKYKGNNIILYNGYRNSICTCSKKEFYNLTMDEKINDYYYILLPGDFDSNLKK